MKSLAFSAVLAALTVTQATAQTCGGSFQNFVSGLATEARELGYDRQTVHRFLDGVAHDPKVIKADRAQGVFQMPFVDFAKRLISQYRIDHGAKNRTTYAQTFARIQRDYGIPPGVLLAF